MKQAKIYFFALSVVYAILLVLGNLDDLTPQGQWRVQAAAWLGEPPDGLKVETMRAGFRGDYPTTVFSIPANENLRRSIIDTYHLEPAGTTKDGEVKYGNKHILPDYADETRPELSGLSVLISPWLLVKPDGSMRFCADDANVEQGRYPVVSLVAHPYPQYLPRGEWELFYRHLALAVLCFLFPALFCCAGWLWLQRQPVSAPETRRICLLIPALVGFIGAFADFYLHGFDMSYSLFSSAFSAGTNFIAALLLVGITALLRKLFDKTV